jgi:hypothetical protein
MSVKQRFWLGALLASAWLPLVLSACAPVRHSSTPAHSELALNEGVKWVVHTNMMAHLRNMERAVQDFERSAQRDHTVLAGSIQDNLGKLVTNCTMEGQAHDELHKWLMPFLGLSAEYAKATAPGLQQQKFAEIKTALTVFNDYFQ